MAGMTRKQRRILLHAVGHDNVPRGSGMRGYRNRYCAAEGDQQAACDELVRVGLMETYQTRGGHSSYRVTRAGCEEIGLQPKEIEEAME